MVRGRPSDHKGAPRSAETFSFAEVFCRMLRRLKFHFFEYKEEQSSGDRPTEQRWPANGKPAGQTYKTYRRAC